MPGKLAALIRSKYPGAYDDMDDAALEQSVIAKYPQYADLAKTDEAPKPMASHASTQPEARTWTDTAVDALPMIGGAVGGLAGAVGGPLGAIGGAALGGAGGEGFRQSINAVRGKGALLTPTAAAAEMAKEAGTQGGAEVVGQGVGRLLSKGASRVYQSILKPTTAARAEYPNLVATGLESAVPVGRGGAEKAGRLVGESVDAADRLVTDRAAQPGAPTIDPRRAVAGISKAVRDVKDLPVARPQMQAIGDYGRQYLAEHPRQIALPEAQQAVRATDRFYNPAYRATMDRGNTLTAGQTAAAVGINDETRNLLRQAVPGLQEQNAKTQALMGLREAIERRAGQQDNNSVVGMRHLISAGLGGAAYGYGGPSAGGKTFLISEALTNPAVASRMAIAGWKLGQHPQALSNASRLALLAMMNGDDDQAGSR